ncbi:MAG: hypothetical protein QNK29_10685 [Desulfobacterales bacterium]|nr:hypothetical protein [Desulfobacterales bacterium]MDX2512410.1 hypothetical protein [Desulfobacterales bacterium]
MIQNSLIDDSERRTGGDRRQFSYAFHIPERRTGGERRDSDDSQDSR